MVWTISASAEILVRFNFTWENYSHVNFYTFYFGKIASCKFYWVKFFFSNWKEIGIAKKRRRYLIPPQEGACALAPLIQRMTCGISKNSLRVNCFCLLGKFAIILFELVAWFFCCQDTLSWVTELKKETIRSKKNCVLHALQK